MLSPPPTPTIPNKTLVPIAGFAGNGRQKTPVSMRINAAAPPNRRRAVLLTIQSSLIRFENGRRIIRFLSKFYPTNSIFTTLSMVREAPISQIRAFVVVASVVGHP